MRKLSAENSLKHKHPDVAAEWNYSLNNDLSPEQVSCGSGRKVWWICKHGHEWEASIAHRCNGTKCPYCSGKKVMPEDSIAEKFPDIAAQWNNQLNSERVDAIAPSSNKKVWWICDKGHEWQATVVSRTSSKSGCPTCLLSKNNLLETFPLIAAEWHPTKNLKLEPSSITYGSGKKVWWLCANGHSYEASVSNRTMGKGCPYCAGQKVSPEMSLAAVNEDLASQWHPTMNKELSPFDFLPHSHKKIWWQCSIFPEHKWQATISSRSQGSGCPKCNNQTSLPELRIYCELKHYFPDAKTRFKIHGREADIFIPSLNLAIEYDGSYYHENKQKEDEKKNKLFATHGIDVIRVRAKPLCLISDNDVSVPEGELTKSQLNQIVSKAIEIKPKASAILSSYKKLKQFIANNEYQRYVDYLPNPFPEDSLESLKPNLVKEWDYELNHPLTPRNFTPGSGKLVWWKCPRNPNHSYEATIASRRTRGCPFCSSKQVSKEMTLQSQYPDIAKEWDVEKNHPETPSQVLAKSNKNFYWICPVGHSYSCSVASRTDNQQGCPECKENELIKSSIGSLHPEIAAQWNNNKNGDTDVYHVLPKSQKKYWWICDKGHEWQAIVASRTDGTGCPICSGRIADSEHNLEAEYPELAQEFDNTLNVKPASGFKSGSGKKVWWRCNKNPEHVWEAQIYSRTKLGTGCPKCFNETRKK